MRLTARLLLMFRTASVRGGGIWTAAGLIGLFAGIYLLPLNARQLAIPDEMRYGEIAREMLVSGDFVVPRLNGLRYFEKPAGGHILNAAAMAVFGETNFAVRLMSSLATGLSALALYFLLKCHHSKQTAALAALIFLTCAEVMGVGTFSVLDSMLSCFVTLALCSFHPALAATGKKRAALLALAGCFAGGAFLVKGFIALAVPVVVIVPFLVFRRRWKDLLTLPWIPLATVTAVSLPWCIAIAAREPDFWRYFFWEEHVRRFFSGSNAQHTFPFWFYVPVFLAGSIPWSLIGPLPLCDLLRKRSSEPVIQFALLWLIMPLLLFSCSSGKLGTYILPCFVPFSLVTAVALADRIELSHVNRSLQAGVRMMGGIVVLSLAATLAVAVLHATGSIPPLDRDFAFKAAGWMLGLSAALLCIVHGLRDRRGPVKLATMGLSAAAIFVTATFCSPTEISPSLGIQRVLESEQHYVGRDTIIIGSPKTVHALCYVYKRDDAYLLHDQGELAYGLSYPEARHRCLAMDQLNDLLKRRRNRRVVLSLKSSPGDSFRDELPAPDYQRQWHNIWFAVFEPAAKPDVGT